MIAPPYDENRVRRSREHLLSSGMPAAWQPEPDMPQQILRSWRRCLLSAVPAAGLSVPYVDGDDRGRLLRHAAAPVIERLAEHLSGLDVAMFLGDSRGRIVLRQVNDRTHRAYLDNLSAAEGFDFSEASVGTNGLGTVVEERQPVFVRGSEHYNEGLAQLACAGVPILQPHTRTLQGSFALTCAAPSASPLMYAMALDIGRQIESRLTILHGDRERALVQAYLAANQSARDPVLVVSERTALANSLGLQHLTNDFHAVLWDHLSNQPCGDGPRTARVPVHGTWRESVVERVAGSGSGATYLVRLLPDATPLPAPAFLGGAGLPQQRRPQRGSAVRAAAGQTVHPLTRVDQQVQTVARLEELLAVIGGPGTGKLTVASAALRQHWRNAEPLVVNMTVAAREEAGWHEQARAALDRGQSVVLHHLQDLPPRQMNLVKALAQHSACGQPPCGGPQDPAGGTRMLQPLVVTLDLELSGQHVRSLVGQIATTVELPELRAIRDYIPCLVTQMLNAPGVARPVTFTTQALQALMRWEWPGNLSELRHTVEQVCRRLPGTTADVKDLPLYLQAAAGRRNLTMMENAERDAIIAALEMTKGSRTDAAAALGIGRTTLYRKIRAHRIPVR